MQQVRPGQPALVNVDLYGKSYTYRGIVEGLVPGSGSVFALLPPDNATGNFIHIVQRVPVRIGLRIDEILKHPLRPGLSTVAAIDVSSTEKSPNAALTEASSSEYKTVIFDDDLAKGKERAEQIINDNLTLKEEALEQACPSGR